MILTAAKRAVAKLPPIRRLITRLDETRDLLDQARRETKETSAALALAREAANELERQIANLAVARDETNITITKDEHAKRTFSHWGEDQVISFIFNGISNGRYLDVGCYHPEVASNTKLLHDNGWTGVNIDPNPFMIDQFKLKRPNDISICMAVASEKSELDFFFFNEWASSNTLSESFAERISSGQNVPIQKKIKVNAIPLRDIMREHFDGDPPDFLNIDVEDLDVEVLQSNDWGIHRPKVVAVEDFDLPFENGIKTPITQILESHGYLFFSRTIYTNFFIDEKFNRE